MIEFGQESRPVVTNARCPRCRSLDLLLVEVGEWTTEWVVTGGRFDRAQGNHEPGGIDHVEAKCRRCFHRWRPRGKWSVDDLVVQPGSKPDGTS